MTIDEDFQGDGLLEKWNFLNLNAPSILRNPFKALRKLGGIELDRLEGEPVLDSLPEKNRFKWQIQTSVQLAFSRAWKRKRLHWKRENLTQRKKRQAAGHLMF
uniref:Uncharacterized protein n=1 Tax=Cucumis sativus TaxID=3659 RepID=A0A0A0LHI8_CUCSA